MVTSSILAICMFLGASLLATYYFENPLAGVILHILTIQFFADNVFRTVSTFFQSIQDTKLQKMMDFLRMFMLMTIVCSLWFLDVGTITNYAWSWSISMLLGVLVSLICLISKYHSYFTFDGWKFEKTEYVRIFKYAFWVMLSANVGTLL
jgi:O-antigen/teichoic acid export membrane protein